MENGMKKEVFKHFEEMGLYANVEISNLENVKIGEVADKKRPCRIIKTRRGIHVIKIWKVNHWEDFVIEMELCKLFPEERLNYTKDFYKRASPRPDEIKKIKTDFEEGYSVEEISRAYKITIKAIETLLSEPKAEEKPVVLIDY